MWPTLKTVAFVTHQIDEAVFLSDRVLVFARPPRNTRFVVRALVKPGNSAIGQSAGTVKSSKYTWLSAFDQRPTRPETGWGRTCSRWSLPLR